MRALPSPQRSWPLAVALLLTALSLAVWLPAAAQADGNGVIAGRVVNKTADGSSIAGEEAVLHIHQLSKDTDEHKQVKLPADGAFRFDGLDTGSDFVYEVSSKHADVEYGSGPLRFEAGKTELPVDLSVWETTDRNPGVTVEQSVVFLLGADRVSQSLRVLEIVTLKNPGDRTFVPRPDGPDGPMGLIRFGLPAGAADLEPTIGLDPDQLIEVDRGFASMTPLPPGDHQAGFAYRIGYDSARFTFGKSLSMGAKDVRFLAPSDGPTLNSRDLTTLTDTQIGQRSYHVLAGRDLAPGSRIAIDLDRLPVRAFWEAPPGQIPVIPILVLGILAVGTVTALALVLRSRRRLQPVAATAVAAEPDADPAAISPAVATAGEDRESLLRALADLDDRYAQGQVTATAYEHERATLKQRLIDVMRGQPAEGGAS